MQLKKEHEDFRGEIWTVTDPRIGEMTLLFTKAGYARGGCVHDQEERLYVLKGDVIIYISNQHWDEGIKGTAKDSTPDINHMHFNKNQPHGFKSDTDSIVLEIKPISTKTERDPIMRKKVQEINDGMEKSK